MIRLAAIWAAVRWHTSMAPTRLGYWLRPYCWRLDDRHWRWQHRREAPCVRKVLTRTEVAVWLRAQLGEDEWARCSPGQLQAMENTLYERQRR